MPASEATAQAPGGPRRWLLIGNSRWHWAEAQTTGFKIWHEEPAAAVATLGVAAPLAWAAVGTVPAAAGLDEGRRLGCSEVPLRDLPPWLGIDRALAGWQAWREQQGRPVLVADAGTVLSLTRVDGEGGFRGGRLLAGVGLQWRAMAAGTAALPDLSATPLPEALLPELAAAAGTVAPPRDAWPRATAAAMVQGVVRGLVAAIAAATAEARQAEHDCRLVLTGGDAPLLLPELAAQIAAPCPVLWRPALCLEALAQLRPSVNSGGEGRSDQERPRSLRI